MRRVKEILLTQYIGAIVIAILAAQGITGLISCVVMPFGVYLNSLDQFRSVFDSSSREFHFPWESILPTFASVLLHLAATVALFRWLFWKEAGEPDPAEKEDQPSDAGAELT